MKILSEGAFKYKFPDRWQAVKWDETGFHKEKFQSFGGSSKAADFVAFAEDEGVLWLIECKDFRLRGRSKKIELCDEIAQKMRSTLAGLVCARNDDDPDIRRFARMALKKCSIRCVVHWEHPLKSHRLWSHANMDYSAIRDKLRQRLRVADPKASLGNQRQLNAVMPWKVV